MNSFANKWLEHLLELDYAAQSWREAGPVPEWDRALMMAPGEVEDLDRAGAKRRGDGRRTARMA